MNRDPQLRIVIVGRDLAIAPLEEAVVAEGASNYICVPTLDAADWLIRDGFDPDLLIVHHALLPKAADFTALRRRIPHAIVLPVAACCERDDVRNAFIAALRRRQEAMHHDVSAVTPPPSLFADQTRPLELS